MSVNTVTHQINKIISNTNNLFLDLNGSLILPSGNTLQRNNTLASIRYNSEKNRFEALDEFGWLPLGPFVSDTDGDTGIFAESFTGSNENTLTFKTLDNIRLIIDDSGNFYINPIIEVSNITNSDFFIENSSGNIGVKTLNPTSDFTVAGVIEAEEIIGVINGGTY